MKVSYGEGIASHTGPESCGCTRKGAVEALTGGRAGWVSSPVILNVRDADALMSRGRLNRPARQREGRSGPAGSQTPCTHASTSQGGTTPPSKTNGTVTVSPVGRFADSRRFPGNPRPSKPCLSRFSPLSRFSLPLHGALSVRSWARSRRPDFGRKKWGGVPLPRRSAAIPDMLVRTGQRGPSDRRPYLPGIARR